MTSRIWKYIQVKAAVNALKEAGLKTEVTDGCTTIRNPIDNEEILFRSLKMGNGTYLVKFHNNLFEGA